jgi:competence protein ComEC
VLDFKDKIFYLTCFSLILVFGVFKVLVFPISPPSFFENQLGEKIAVSGEVVASPEQKENSQKLLVEIEEVGEKTKMLVTVASGLDFAYGDEVYISGVLEKPENFITDTGKEFDYINYLAKDGIFYLINYAKVEVVSTSNGNPVKRALFAFKEKFLEKINYAILGNESLLMGGLILGEKASFSQELRQKFIDTGTIHIIALSGYNITIVAEWFMKL